MLSAAEKLEKILKGTMALSARLDALEKRRRLREYPDNPPPKVSHLSTRNAERSQRPIRFTDRGLTAKISISDCTI